MKKFIKIQNLRYRLITIKRYEPFQRPDLNVNQFGIYIYLTTSSIQNRVYHTFKTRKERDEVILALDSAFGV